MEPGTGSGTGEGVMAKAATHGEVVPYVGSTILGAAAEHYVMCQLLRRGMIAALAPVGVPDADIIVSNRLGSALAAVQVKARRDIGSDGGWHMKIKHESINRPLLFYAFVDFGVDLIERPWCWIVPSSIVADVLARSHQVWLKQPGKGGKARNDHDMRRFLPSYEHLDWDEFRQGWLEPYREAWAQIASASALEKI